MSDKRFEVGASITWVDSVFEEDDGKGGSRIGVHECTATITKITPATVLLLSNGRETRLNKYLLADRVRDWELGELIKASMVKIDKPNDTTLYTIYALSDPNTGITHYVGISKNIQRRYKQHCSCSGVNLQKNLWIIELLQRKQIPSLHNLGTAIGLQAAKEREKIWILHYQSLGMPLTNIEGMV